LGFFFGFGRGEAEAEGVFFCYKYLITGRPELRGGGGENGVTGGKRGEGGGLGGVEAEVGSFCVWGPLKIVAAYSQEL